MVKINKRDKMCRCIDSRAICVMGSFIALVGGVCLAIFTALTTKPYHYAKDFNEVTCTSEGYISFDTCCAFTSRTTCDPYPCIRTTVSYRAASGVPISRVNLYYDFQSAEYQGENATCTFYDCPLQYDDAKKELESIITEYGNVGRQFTCYYNEDHSVVIIKTVELSAVIHSWIWPTAAFIVGIVIALMAYYEKIGQPAPHDEEDEEFFDGEAEAQDYSAEGGRKGFNNKVGAIDELDSEIDPNETTRTKTTLTGDKVHLTQQDGDVTF